MFINKLPVSLSNQIAAGEVVERPASVVKELLENALDAGATRIILEIRDAGRTLIKVRDNGSGIVKEDLPLALAPHATSKIAAQEDLEGIKTLGFRGEALASIASVSQLELTSRSADSTEAYAVRVEGPQMESLVEPAAHPQGTTVEVRELFFNTPGRRRFLKSDRTEYARIKNVFVAAAAAYPQIAFEFYSDGKSVYKLTPASDAKIKSRLGKVIDPLYDKEAIDFNCQEGELTLRGYLLPPPPMESSAQEQVFLILNGRSVSDKVLVHALKEAYLEVNGIACPVRCVIYIDCPYQWVDVNVHPRKLEVRFHDSRAVHDCLCATVLQALKDGGVVQRYVQPEPRRLKVQETLPLEKENLSSYATADGSYHHLKFADGEEQKDGAQTGINDSLSPDGGEAPQPKDPLQWSLKNEGGADAEHKQEQSAKDESAESASFRPSLSEAGQDAQARTSGLSTGSPFKPKEDEGSSSFRLDLSDEALAAFNDQDTLHSAILEQAGSPANTKSESATVQPDEQNESAQASEHDFDGTRGAAVSEENLDHQALLRQARYYEGSVESRLKLDLAHASAPVAARAESSCTQVLAMPHPAFALVCLKNRYFLVYLNAIRQKIEAGRYREAVKDNSVEQTKLAMPFAIKAESSLLRALKLHPANVLRCGFECKIKKDSVVLFKIPVLLEGCDLAAYAYKALHLIAASPISLEDGSCPLQLSDLLGGASLKDAYTLSEAEALCAGVDDPKMFKELGRCAELDINGLMRDLLS